MNDKVLSLSKARKGRAKAQKRTLADENAMKFGQTKAQKNLTTTRLKISEAILDGHKRDV